MNTVELQKEIIARIATTSDSDLLNSIKTMLDFGRKEPILYLTPEEEQELIQASNEVQEGNFTSKPEMDKKVKKWLKE